MSFYASLPHLPGPPAIVSTPIQSIALSPELVAAILAGAVDQAAAELLAGLVDRRRYLTVNDRIKIDSDRFVIVLYRRGEVRVTLHGYDSAPDDPGTEISTARLCLVCWWPLDPGTRSDARCCSAPCRSLLSMANRRAGVDLG